MPQYINKTGSKLVPTSNLGEAPVLSNTTNDSADQHWRTKFCPYLVKSGSCGRRGSCPFAHSTTDLRNRPDLKKTKLCDNYMKGCCIDANCKWAHGRHELRFTDDFYKTSLCKYWVESVCYAGHACRHAHGDADLRPRKLVITGGSLKSVTEIGCSKKFQKKSANSYNNDEQNFSVARKSPVVLCTDNEFKQPANEESVQQEEKTKNTTFWESETQRLLKARSPNTSEEFSIYTSQRQSPPLPPVLSSVPPSAEIPLLPHPFAPSERLAKLTSSESLEIRPHSSCSDNDMENIRRTEEEQLQELVPNPDTLWEPHLSKFLEERFETQHHVTPQDIPFRCNSWVSTVDTTSPRIAPMWDSHSRSLESFYGSSIDLPTKNTEMDSSNFSPLLPTEIISALGLADSIAESNSQNIEPSMSSQLGTQLLAGSCGIHGCTSHFLEDNDENTQQRISYSSLIDSSSHLAQSASNPTTILTSPEQHWDESDLRTMFNTKLLPASSVNLLRPTLLYSGVLMPFDCFQYYGSHSVTGKQNCSLLSGETSYGNKATSGQIQFPLIAEDSFDRLKERVFESRNPIFRETS